MNVRRSTLRRRQLLKSGALAAFGALTSAAAGHRLFQFPGSSAEETAVVLPPRPLDDPEPPPEIVDCTDDVSDPTAGESSDNFVELQPELRPLSREEDYASFLDSLGLRHICAEEVIEPHRSVHNGIENELPPEPLWDKLVPTLRVADEIRARLGRPLVRFSSAYRSPRYNCQIPGAVHNSYHTHNQALDIVYFCSSRDACQVALELRREGFFRGGIGLYPSFIHIDTRGRHATWGV